jgi:hypothetical protein
MDPAEAARRHLAQQARERDGVDGDRAAIALARRTPELGFVAFAELVVPPGEMTTHLFNRLSDAHDQAARERELDQQLADVEIPKEFA